MCVWVKVVIRNGFIDELMVLRSEFICFLLDFEICFGEVRLFLSVKVEEFKLFCFKYIVYVLVYRLKIVFLYRRIRVYVFSIFILNE